MFWRSQNHGGSSCQLKVLFCHQNVEVNAANTCSPAMARHPTRGRQPTPNVASHPNGAMSRPRGPGSANAAWRQRHEHPTYLCRKEGTPNISNRNQPCSHSMNTCVANDKHHHCCWESTTNASLRHRLLRSPSPSNSVWTNHTRSRNRNQSWPPGLINNSHVFVKKGCTQSRRWGTVKFNFWKNIIIIIIIITRPSSPKVLPGTDFANNKSWGNSTNTTRRTATKHCRGCCLLPFLLQCCIRPLARSQSSRKLSNRLLEPRWSEQVETSWSKSSAPLRYEHTKPWRFWTYWQQTPKSRTPGKLVAEHLEHQQDHIGYTNTWLTWQQPWRLGFRPIWSQSIPSNMPNIITNNQIWNIHYLARTIFTTNLSTFHVPLSVFCTTEAFPCSRNHCMPRRRWVDSAMPETLTQIAQVSLISMLIPGIVWTNPPLVNVTIVRKHSHSWQTEKKENSYSKPFLSKLLPERCL